MRSVCEVSWRASHSNITHATPDHPPAGWDETKMCMLNHINALRSDSNFTDAYFVLSIESNLGQESDHYREFLLKRRARHLVFMDECPNKSRIGTHTTENIKDQMQLTLNDTLTDGRIQFYNRIHTTENDAEAMKRSLFRQLENYSAITKKTSGKRTFTGKIGTEQDDLAMVLQMNLLYRRIFRKDVDKKYERFHRHWDS